ncbi:hypothetical protein CK203_105810 [Vitis vinifera]|uniref:Uncharacterized protein n=1 Tax=Vitis vinifera TaxID=29760 RepID=A0A438D7Q0_VITVI|nr:hypothetical protein CK203_105810 [Vitis vinifera]
MQHKMQLQTMKKGGETMVEYLLKMKVFITSRSESLKFEDVATLLMAHETRLEQHHHNSVETGPFGH